MTVEEISAEDRRRAATEPPLSEGRPAGLSHVRGATHSPLLDATIGGFFDAACERWADHPALIVRHQKLARTYRELKADVEQLATSLLASGLAPGDRIGVWARNCFEWVATQLAAAKAGLIFVGLNPSYRGAEIEYALNKTGCKALILARRSGRDDFLGMLRELAPELASARPGQLAAARLPHLRLVAVIGASEAGTLEFRELMARGPKAEKARLDRLAARLRPHDAINIQMTSGTTAAAKGVTLSHAQILNNAFFVGGILRLGEQDRICLPVPLYHSFGMVAGILAAIAHGSAVVLPGEGFSPLPGLQAIAQERCTAVLGVPSMFLAMMDHPAFAEFDLSSLRTGIMSCSPCPIELMRRAIERMNLREITIAYGMTETSPVTFQSAPDDSLERRVATVGRVHPHVEAKIVDASGRTVPLGTEGELMIRGYSVTLGYWDDPALTSEAIDPQGWLRTGDLAMIDREGYCRIVGRIKDTINCGGEKISPREVEEVLYAHFKVREAYVIGVPDRRQGETVCAWIRLDAGAHATAAEIREFCRARLARYKVPRYVMFVDSFPVTANGKVRKAVMRERSIATLGIGVASPAVTAPAGEL
jgi:fatty-acyl-CoA synthase